MTYEENFANCRNDKRKESKVKIEAENLLQTL